MLVSVVDWTQGRGEKLAEKSEEGRQSGRGEELLARMQASQERALTWMGLARRGGETIIVRTELQQSY